MFQSSGVLVIVAVLALAEACGGDAATDTVVPDGRDAAVAPPSGDGDGDLPPKPKPQASEEMPDQGDGDSIPVGVDDPPPIPMVPAGGRPPTPTPDEPEREVQCPFGTLGDVAVAYLFVGTEEGPALSRWTLNMRGGVLDSLQAGWPDQGGEPMPCVLSDQVEIGWSAPQCREAWRCGECEIVVMRQDIDGEFEWFMRAGSGGYQWPGDQDPPPLPAQCELAGRYEVMAYDTSPPTTECNTDCLRSCGGSEACVEVCCG